MSVAVETEQLNIIADSDDRLPYLQRDKRVAYELLIAVLAVLLFFSILLGVLNVFLPTGIGLKQQQDGGSASAIGSRELEFAQGGEMSDVVARLAGYDNKVNVKAASGIAWSGADDGMSFFERDALQTYDLSRALIEFDEQNYLEVGENSLVIFQRLEPDLFVKNMRNIQLLVEGELRGKFSVADGNLTNLQIGDMQLLHDEDIEFKLTMNKDNTATLAMFEGRAQLLIGGEAIDLGENYALKFGPDGKPLNPELMATQPLLKSPKDQTVIYYRDLPKKIVFSWKPSQPVDGYRFILAKDADFRRILVDEPLAHSVFRHGNLKGGQYYWRVHGVANEVDGFPSETRQLVVVQDEKPPKLRLKDAPKVVKKETFTVRGKTEPYAKLYIDGERAQVGADGIFQHEIQVKPGATLVVVESVDAAGNVAYATQLITGKF